MLSQDKADSLPESPLQKSYEKNQFSKSGRGRNASTTITGIHCWKSRTGSRAFTLRSGGVLFGKLGFHPTPLRSASRLLCRGGYSTVGVLELKNNPMKEHWKPVLGYEGHFEVSNMGRVRALKLGQPARILKPHIDRKHGHGRKSVCFDYKCSRKLVHRLVLEAFVGPCPKGMECAHINGNAGDNRLENLRWDTHQNNMRDVVKHGTAHRPRGTANAMAKINEAQALEIANSSLPQRTLAKLYGISQAAVSAIRLGGTWTWLTKIKKH